MKRAALVALAAEQWVRQPAARVALDLPLPISTNRLWSASRRRLVASKEYKAWKAQTGIELTLQRPGRIVGNYHLTITVSSDWGGDLGNCEKAVSDLLQEHGVIANDRDAARISMGWSDDVPGMRVLLEPA